VASRTPTRNPRVRLIWLVLASLAAVAATALEAQDDRACELPVAPRPAEQNIFTAQQERDLGDAMHEHEQLRVIEDAELNAYLERIGDRLLGYMPATDLRFRYSLWNYPIATAVSLPGGRIYVTRKLVAAARSEDEVAGVLAHELGHALARDSAVLATRSLRQALGVREVGDRQDVTEKYHLLLESAGRNREAFRNMNRDDAREQVAADQVAIYALARAGYRVEAFAEFWDRLFETRGETGSWLSDLFGRTKPEARRLREMLKTQAKLPPACIEPRVVADDEFRAWQAAVVADRGLSSGEKLDGVLWKKPLEPPLQAGIHHLRFSPDGRFVLAQDGGGIFVLSRGPFVLLFRVDAPGAANAQFSADSKRLLFHTPDLRVETWDLASGKRVSVAEVARFDPCIQTALSPDGKLLACFDIRSRLALIDVETGAEVLETKELVVPGSMVAATWLGNSWFTTPDRPVSSVRMRYSPDGRYFVAGAHANPPVAFDLGARAAVNLPGVFRRLTPLNFTFVGPDRFVGVDADDPSKSALVRFPSGEHITYMQLNPFSQLSTTTAGDYLVLRPAGRYPAVAIELSTQKPVLANQTAPALDLYHDLFVSEASEGGLELRRRTDFGKNERVAAAALPRSPLGRLQALSVTPDFKWLGLSERLRGAVWNLETGERVAHVRAFSGVHIEPEASVLYADFPTFAEQKRSIVKLDLAARKILEERAIENDAYSFQLGDRILRTRFGARAGSELGKLEASDARSGDLVWSRALPRGSFRIFYGTDGASVVIAWMLADRRSQSEIRSNDWLKELLARLRKNDSEFLMEVLDTRTGRLLGGVPVDTGKGSFDVQRVQAAGDVFSLEDTLGRVLVYSLSTGELRGRLFATNTILAGSGRLLAAHAGAGRVSIFDVARLEKRKELRFASPVIAGFFPGDERRYFALTADQTAYAIDLGSP
jgi:hypothetical protein